MKELLLKFKELSKKGHCLALMSDGLGEIAVHVLSGTPDIFIQEFTDENGNIVEDYGVLTTEKIISFS